MAVLTCKYDFGDIVYLKTDSNQDRWLVTDIQFNGGPNNIRYTIANGFMNYEAYELELSVEVDKSMKLGLENLQQ